MAIQAALPLDWPPDEAEDSFIVTSSNAAAVRLLERPATWPVAVMLLAGPRKSGRSLLARIFARRSGGCILDDAERRDERALFSAWNEAQATRRPLVIVVDAPPPAWQIVLPDLRSRLAATPVATIEPPDPALTGRLLEQLLARRGLPLAPEVVAYLTPRLPRSHAAVIAVADALDAASLASKRAITIPLARGVLGLAAIDAGHEVE